MDNELIDNAAEDAKANKFMADIEPFMDAFVKDGGIAMMIVIAPDGFHIRTNLDTQGRMMLLMDAMGAIGREENASTA